MDFILFDLDGTIIDSDQGVVNSVIYAAEHFGIEIKDRAALRVFLGPPLGAMFMEYFGFDEEKAAVAEAKYRERYGTVGVYENTIYDGMEDAVKLLHKSGKKLCLATSKPEKFARMILEQHNITEYFDDITGATIDGKISTKDEVIAELLRRQGITNMSNILMVGDRFYDVEGSKKFGIDCMGVTFGFGTEDELVSAGAKYIAHSPKEMADIILDI